MALEMSFWLYFKKEKEAEEITETLSGEGYVTGYPIRNPSGKFLVHVKYPYPDQSVSPENLSTLLEFDQDFQHRQSKMKELARRYYGGEYDGWEVEVQQ